MRASLLLVTALVSLSCSTPHTLSSFQGSITMRTSGGAAGSHDMIVKAKGDKLRFDMTGPGGNPTSAIYDPKTNTVIVVMDAQKAYMNLDFASPAAPKANTDPSSSTITKAGGHKTIAGYDCEIWSIKDATGRRSDVCIAAGIAFVDLARMGSGGKAPESPLAKEFREQKSFPLESVEYDEGGKELSRMEVVKIEAASLPDSDFVVPAGYAKVEAPAKK